MDVKGFKELLGSLWKLQQGEGTSGQRKNVAALIAGMDGVGKNQIAEVWAKEQGLDCVIIKPGQGDGAGDFLGLPEQVPLYPDPYDQETGTNVTARYTAGELSQRVNEVHGKTYTEALDIINEKYQAMITHETRYSLPSFWPRQGKGLLILDELNRGGAATESALLEVVRERKLSLADYQVPEDWMVIGLINPPTADFLGVRDMDAAMESRFVCFNYVPEREEWLEYARSANLNDTVTGFIAEHPQFLGNESFKNPILEGLKPRPRRLEILADLLEVVDEDSPLYFECLLGTLGKEGAMTFLQYAKSAHKPVRGREVLDSYTAAVSKKIKEHLDKERNDLVAVTIDDLVSHMETISKDLTDKQIKNICKFLTDIRKDLRIKLAHQLGNSDQGTNAQRHFGKLQTNDEFAKIILDTVKDSNIRN